jgi:hypothetical protein
MKIRIRDKHPGNRNTLKNTGRNNCKKFPTSGIGWRRQRVAAMPVETPIMSRAFFRERFSKNVFLLIYF